MANLSIRVYIPGSNGRPQPIPVDTTPINSPVLDEINGPPESDFWFYDFDYEIGTNLNELIIIRMFFNKIPSMNPLHHF